MQTVQVERRSCTIGFRKTHDRTDPECKFHGSSTVPQRRGIGMCLCPAIGAGPRLLLPWERGTSQSKPWGKKEGKRSCSVKSASCLKDGVRDEAGDDSALRA